MISRWAVGIDFALTLIHLALLWSPYDIEIRINIGL